MRRLRHCRSSSTTKPRRSARPTPASRRASRRVPRSPASSSRADRVPSTSSSRRSRPATPGSVPSFGLRTTRIRPLLPVGETRAHRRDRPDGQRRVHGSSPAPRGRQRTGRRTLGPKTLCPELVQTIALAAAIALDDLEPTVAAAVPARPPSDQTLEPGPPPKPPPRPEPNDVAPATPRPPPSSRPWMRLEPDRWARCRAWTCCGREASAWIPLSMAFRRA
jgi:hypothetical protein